MHTLRPGDVFGSRLPNGQYGAVKVLAVSQGSSLIAVSKWIGDTPPTGTTPGLLDLASGLTAGPQPLLSTFEAAWYPGHPSSDVTFVGNFPLSDDELKYETPNWATGWHPFMAARVLVREKGMSGEDLWRLVREASPPVQQESFAVPMGLARFWKLIHDHRPCDDECSRLVDSLASLAPQAIRSFHERLSRLLWRLDTSAHATAIGHTPSNYFSPDGFLYRRCFVVGQGRSTYDRVLADAKNMPTTGDCEDLVAAAPQALARRERLEDEPFIPTSISFETYSNAEGWKAIPEQS